MNSRGEQFINGINKFPLFIATKFNDFIFKFWTAINLSSNDKFSNFSLLCQTFKQVLSSFTLIIPQLMLNKKLVKSSLHYP